MCFLLWLYWEFLPVSGERKALPLNRVPHKRRLQRHPRGARNLPNPLKSYLQRLSLPPCYPLALSTLI